ncbi:uncharacterized protein si:ch211-243a20.4 isoform X2 [Dunckerocampus dactyliophorus]|uniref:uncharacterized protein si:ch211-243a20.4 isoform X2 n=1 Tax=Dunckerocampus dactyliophorus TaxID=161453 RepID=UPI002405B089|nr:uncharacterized protein si:ch211-243a20.4 isoform X2 [Dunckerocampus dactyliophorus]
MPSMKQYCLLAARLSWIFKMLLPFCVGTESPRFVLRNTAFVAFTGEDLHVHFDLRVPLNQSKDDMTCFDPFHRPIFNRLIPPTIGHSETIREVLQLHKLQTSGEYHCQYKMARAYWFVRLRDEGYRDVVRVDYTDFIIVGFFSGVLLVFSVVGSVYVFRGTWKQIPECGNPSKERKQKKERTQAKRPEDDDMGVIITSSTSLYASLEPRPLSVYDVLDHSAVNIDSHERKPALKSKSGQKPVAQSPQAQDEGVFESVYENF